MLGCQFLCHVLKALFSIKIALKLSSFCKKMQNFRALGASPPHPHWPLVTGGPAPTVRISGYEPEYQLVAPS